MGHTEVNYSETIVGIPGRHAAAEANTVTYRPLCCSVLMRGVIGNVWHH